MTSITVLYEEHHDGLTVQYGRFDPRDLPPCYDFPLLVAIADGGNEGCRETIIDRNWVTAVLGRFAVYPPEAGQSDTLGRQVVAIWRDSWLKDAAEPKVLGGLEAIRVIGFVGTLVHGTEVAIEQINAVRLLVGTSAANGKPARKPRRRKATGTPKVQKAA
jgi:hypothetical protein